MDLRGARLSAAAACRQLSGLAPPEPRGDPVALPGLRPAGPGGHARANRRPLARRRPAHLGLAPPRVARRDYGARPCPRRT